MKGGKLLLSRSGTKGVCKFYLLSWLEKDRFDTWDFHPLAGFASSLVESQANLRVDRQRQTQGFKKTTRMI